MRAWSWLPRVCGLAFACAIFALIALAPRTAFAQSTVTGITGVVTRLEDNGSTSADNSNEHPHPNGVLVNDINFEDCTADLQYGFELLIGNISSSYELQAWVGTQDCSVLANRQSATAVCWPVVEPQNATTNPWTVKVRMQDIVSEIFDTSHAVTYSRSDSDVCQLQQTTGSTSITLYFFFTDLEGNPVGSEATYPITVGLRAGDVQGPISLGVGDTLLIVNVPPTTDPSVQEWNVYCDPPPGQEGAQETIPVDAASNNGVCTTTTTTTTSDTGSPTAIVDSSVDDGAAEDAAIVDSAVPTQLDEAGGNACGVVLNDAEIPSPGGCSTSSVLVAGGGGAGLTSSVDEAGVTTFEEASTVDTIDEAGVAFTGGTMSLIPSKYVCGTASAASTKINVKNLKDGYYYNIAVGAVDALGNVGPLSNVECGEPVPVIDFWKRYYEDGGRAGGGFCSTEGIGTPAGTSGLGVVMLASIVAIVRRRRRK